MKAIGFPVSFSSDTERAGERGSSRVFAGGVGRKEGGERSVGTLERAATKRRRSFTATSIYEQLSSAVQALFVGGLLVGCFAASVAAQNVKYAGTTTETFDGSQGYFAPHRACAREFKQAVWCTSEMIIEGGPHLFAANIPEEGAWVNPAVVGGESGLLVDFSGIDRGWPFLNCIQWQVGVEDEPNARRGLVIKPGPNSGGPTFDVEACGEIRRAACCSEFGPRPIFAPFGPGLGR